MVSLKKFVVKMTGNRLAQNLLGKNVRIAQFLMGIGAGTGVESSGERGVLELLHKNYSDPYCIFDVGSNKGQYCKLISDILSGLAFSVHCFEPSLYTFNILNQNVSNNHNVKLNNVALGSQKGETTLHYDRPGSGLASLTKRRLEHFNVDLSESETVSVTTVDLYCAENNIEHIHLLKVDVEGCELDVLTGARAMFTSDAIDIVTFEFGGCNIDSRSYVQDFYYVIQDFKMELFRITPSGYLFPMGPYKEDFEQFRTTNFVAVKRK